MPEDLSAAGRVKALDTFTVTPRCLSCFVFVCNFSKAAECLELTDTDLDLRSAVLLDYYVAAVWWCREQSYTAEQTSAFFTVIDTLFHNLGTYLFVLRVGQKTDCF